MAVSTSKIAPGIDFKLRDLSEYVQNVPSTVGFIAIVSERGPDNQMVFTNARDFSVDFGQPNINYGGKQVGQGPYVAKNFLTQSDSLYVVRVLPTDAEFSNLYIWGNLTDSTKVTGVDSFSGLNTEREIITQFSENTIDSTEFVTDVEADNLVIFHGVGRGDWYNNFKIKVSQHRNNVKAAAGVYLVDIYQRQNDDDYNPDTGQFEAQYEILNSFEVSFNPDDKDTDGESLFVEDVINRHSRYIKCKADRDACKIYAINSYDFSEGFVDPIVLENGSVGSLWGTGVTTQLLSQAYVGELPKIWGNVAYDEDGNLDLESPIDAEDYVVDEVTDVEFFYFNIVLDGGYASAVKDQIVSLVKDLRQDCVALIDNGDNATANAALAKRQDRHDYNDWHTALYEPYSKVYDVFTGQYLWITPVYHMAKVVVYTENVSELWYAAAGFNRGTLDNVVDLRYSASPGQRDQFYLNQINPIVKFIVGDTVWGQLTTQRRPTAMQDLSVARLILYIKRALEQFCKYYIFEINDETTWNAIKNNIDGFLRQIQNKTGLYSYSTEVGANDYEIKSKQVHVNVKLKPTRVIERINLTFFVE